MEAKKRKLGANDAIQSDEGSRHASTPDRASLNRADGKPHAVYKFKNPNFEHSMKLGANSKRRMWKNLKQIVAAEKSLQWKPTDVTYSNLEAPPSFTPAKKYSDISGLPAKYVDPHSKLRYASAEEFTQIRTLPSDIIAGLLQLRKANSVAKYIDPHSKLRYAFAEEFTQIRTLPSDIIAGLLQLRKANSVVG